MQVLILGSQGGFGRLFARLLNAAGMEVIGADLGLQSQTNTAVREYFAVNVLHPNQTLLDCVAQSSWLILALPESVVLQALPGLTRAMAPGALVVDTLSIKTPVAAMSRTLRHDIEHLSINPMFAPDVGFAQQNVAAIPLKPGPHGDAFIAHLEKWGSHVTRLDATTHDQQAALTQGAVHAAVLAFATYLARSGHDPALTWSISTPPYRLLMALAARLLTKDPEVYWEIQKDNPFVAEVRAGLVAALTEIERRLTKANSQEFQALFKEIRQRIIDPTPEVVALSDRVIKLVNSV